MSEFPRGVCNDRFQTLPRHPDADIFYIHCTGGFRCAKIDSDRWTIEPILEGGEVRAKGYLNKSDLERFISVHGYRVIGFQSAGWTNGRWHSNWRPMTPGRTSHLHGPADTWSSISQNYSRDEKMQKLENLNTITLENIEKIINDRSTEERLSQSISLSLRSMDVAVEGISDFYNEHLVNCMYGGQISGQRTGSPSDQLLFAQVHSFFLHLGAARDYLAAFIAHRLGLNAAPGKTDTINALEKKLEAKHIGNDRILDLLISKQWLTQEDNQTGKWVTSGWLKKVGKLRNDIVHRRPYGLHFQEKFGWTEPVQKELGIYRYTRPVHLDELTQTDLLDVVCSHYQTCNDFFLDAAHQSGLDSSMFTLTDEHILSINNP